ncbi:MAG: DUF1549 and DUF1553 domain-containing protein [Verrucomicrobiales bacterium]
MSGRKNVSLGVLAALSLSVASGEKPIAEADRDHWSFRSPVREEPPLVGGVESPIDRFLLARLAAEGFDFAPEADRRTLIRRLTFDLTGLPPDATEVDAFVADATPEAYGRLVDRLLATPAYGERWAQPWLDVVRFAETDGFEHDAVRPDAWRYRDWVIAAMNTDLPYDRFIQFQLAGDELASDDEAARDATGYLLAGPDMPDMNLPEERRHNLLNGITANIGEAFLGITLACAQCHDHKTDPISIDEFYRLRAVFANSLTYLKRDQKLGPVFVEDGRDAPPSFVMLRGDFRRPGAAVAPGFPRVLDPAGTDVPPPEPSATTSMRRSALARWLTNPEHPLTARVIINRLWQQYFGTGLVASAGDFGHTGERPSHPELFDWLATELPRQGWRLKEIHRLIVSSQAYRQASRGTGDAWGEKLMRDPGNRWFSRQSRRRLDGEVIRDSFLAVSGRLNRATGGPGVRPPLPTEVTATLLRGQWEVTPDEAGHRRRSIYLFARRNLRYPIFEAFDRPDGNIACSRRDRSTTAPQSLMLLNSEFSLATAKALAARVAEESEDPTARINAVYSRLLARPPTVREREVGLAFLANGSFVDYCLALLNTNEAVYID